jgi:C2H2-type zinc finger
LFSEEAILQPCRVDLGPNENAKANDIKKQVQVSYGNCVSTNQQDDKKKQKDLEAQHRCMLCNRAFNYHRSMLQHMHNKHAGMFILCKHNGKCSRIFRTEAEKSEHLLEVRNGADKLMKCDFCCQMYPKNGKSRHFKIHHKNLIRCSYALCSYHFCSEVEKQNHEDLIHASTEKMKCIFCNLYFPTHTMLVHLKYMHKSLIQSAFKCNFKCRRYFLTEAERNEHIASVHSKYLFGPQFKCIYCNKMLTDKRTLNTHVHTKHSLVKICCKVYGCNKFFLTRTEADSHYEQQHQKIEEQKKFCCFKCRYRSASEYHFRKHISAMHGDKYIPCPKCFKRFSSSSALKGHIRRVHSAHKACPHCKTSYVNIKKHLKQEKCKMCQNVMLCRSACFHKKVQISN